MQREINSFFEDGIMRLVQQGTEPSDLLMSSALCCALSMRPLREVFNICMFVVVNTPLLGDWMVYIQGFKGVQRAKSGSLHIFLGNLTFMELTFKLLNIMILFPMYFTPVQNSGT